MILAELWWPGSHDDDCHCLGSTAVIWDGLKTKVSNDGNNLPAKDDASSSLYQTRVVGPAQLGWPMSVNWAAKNNSSWNFLLVTADDSDVSVPSWNVPSISL